MRNVRDVGGRGPLEETKNKQELQKRTGGEAKIGLMGGEPRTVAYGGAKKLSYKIGKGKEARRNGLKRSRKQKDQSKSERETLKKSSGKP